MVLEDGNSMKKVSVYQSLFIFLCSSFLVISCSSIGLSNKDELFKKIITLKDMNSTIRFQKPDSRVNTFKIEDEVFLILENLSGDFIEFPSNYGVRIFTFDQGEWKELTNGAGYFPQPGSSPGNTGPRITPKGQEDPNLLGVPLFPVIGGNMEKITIRVVIIGNIMKTDVPTSQEAGAYVDVTLHR